MRAKTTIVFAAATAALLAGCGDLAEPSAEFETEGWIDTMPPSPPTPKPLEGGEGEEEDEDEGFEEGAFWSLFGTYDGAEFGELEGEFFAESDTQELCAIFFEVSFVGPATGCDACTEAWEFQLGAPEYEVDVDCASFTLGEIEGQILKLGVSGEVLYREQDGAWAEIGFAELIEGELILEWEHQG